SDGAGRPSRQTPASSGTACHPSGIVRIATAAPWGAVASGVQVVATTRAPGSAATRTGLSVALFAGFLGLLRPARLLAGGRGRRGRRSGRGRRFGFGHGLGRLGLGRLLGRLLLDGL